MPKKQLKGKLRYLPFLQVPEYLTCPKCFISPSSLVYKNNCFVCSKCKYKYPINGRIIELINKNVLGKQAKSELSGNEITPTKENIEHYAKKDQWSKYYNHIVKQKIDYLMRGLEKAHFEGLISLGSGPGFEIKEILKRKRFPLAFSSDIAITATSIVPHTLKGYNVEICLFTSDLNHPPALVNDKFPILIYEALHHTDDSVKTLGNLMRKGYYDIFFVEPCTNFFVKFLAKIGLAQRIEYSGVRPDFLDLNKIKEVAKKYNYKIYINTLWDIPEEYVRKICSKGSATEKVIQKFTDLFSQFTNLLNFGSFAIVHLAKNVK